jgi:hypothetical protein
LQSRKSKAVLVLAQGPDWRGVGQLSDCRHTPAGRGQIVFAVPVDDIACHCCLYFQAAMVILTPCRISDTVEARFRNARCRISSVVKTKTCGYLVAGDPTTMCASKCFAFFNSNFVPIPMLALNLKPFLIQILLLFHRWR